MKVGEKIPPRSIMDGPLFAAWAALFLLSILPRLWPLLAVDHHWEDAYYYMALAKSLTHGRFELLGSFHAKYLPGFPLAIVLVHSLLLGAADWFKSAQLVSLIASSSVPGLCLALARDITGDWRAGWAAGLAAAFNAALVTYAGVPFGEAFFTFMALLYLVLITRRPLLAGAVGGWAALSRHEGWFLLAAAALVLVASRRDKARATRTLLSMVITIVMASAWWAVTYIETGKLLFQTYVGESAERAPQMGRTGVSFLFMSLPVGGHAATLLALIGLPFMVRKKEAWPLLVFFVLYSALHAWWMFNVERYFLPLTPAVMVAAGVGAWLAVSKAFAGRLNNLKDHAGVRARPFPRVLLLVPLLGLLAGLSHFLGFAPGMIREEAERNLGYYKAIKYVGEKKGDFAILAYDVFMVEYHAKKETFPSARLPEDDWASYVPRLYLEKGVRYIIWSSLYPVDRRMEELSGFETMAFPGTAEVGGRKESVVIMAAPEKNFPWVYRVTDYNWLSPRRKSREAVMNAMVYRLELGKSR